MNIVIGFDVKSERIYKGQSLIDFPDNYVLVDIETTGLDPKFDRIIEISAIKIKENKVLDTFSTLVNPCVRIDTFITDLTGITNEMVKDSPTIENVLPTFLDFIQDNIIVGHNINFDINFLYDYCNLCGLASLKNSFIDTMRLSRRIFKDIPNYKLQTVASYLNVNIDISHRSLNDCQTTFAVYNKLKEIAITEFESVENFIKSCKKTNSIRAKNIIVTDNNFDPDNLLYGKNIAITGVLERFSRKEAMQIITNIGGICNDNVISKTNYLILGNNDYNSILKGNKSSKLIKAEKMKLEGKDIEILSENTFYDLISNYIELMKQTL